MARVQQQMELADAVGAETARRDGDFVVIVQAGSGTVALRCDGFDGVRELPESRLAPVAAPFGDCRTGTIRHLCGATSSNS